MGFKPFKIIGIAIVLLMPMAIVCAQAEHASKTAAAPGMNLLDEQNLLNTEPSPFLSGVDNSQAVKSQDSLKDHKAKIYSFKGDVRVLKSGTQLWLPVQAWMSLEVGDKVRTGKDSSLEIAYDDFFLNIVRIDENTIAEFRNIEPTDLFLSDGTVFSAVDGLKVSGSYQVSTPVAVAAVRGTHFDVMFNAETQVFSTATIPVTDDGHTSLIEVLSIDESGEKTEPVQLAEGMQMDMNAGQILSAELVGEIDPARVEQAKEYFSEMTADVDNFFVAREEGKSALNESGESVDPNTKKDDDPYAGNGPGNGGSGGGLNSTESRLGNFNADRFVDRALEADNPAPLQDMTSFKMLENHDSSDKAAEEKPGDHQNSSRAGFSMEQMLDFMKVGGESGKSEVHQETLQAMTHLMESMDVSQDRVNAFTDYYSGSMTNSDTQYEVGGLGGYTGDAEPYLADMTTASDGSTYDGMISEPQSGDFSTDSFTDSTMDYSTSDMTDDMMDSTMESTMTSIQETADATTSNPDTANSTTSINYGCYGDTDPNKTS